MVNCVNRNFVNFVSMIIYMYIYIIYHNSHEFQSETKTKIRSIIALYNNRKILNTKEKERLVF